MKNGSQPNQSNVVKDVQITLNNSETYVLPEMRRSSFEQLRHRGGHDQQIAAFRGCLPEGCSHKARKVHGRIETALGAHKRIVSCRT
jgi:hypothetical protein